MGNEMPRNPAQAIDRGVNNSEGLALYGVELEITNVTKSQVDDGVAALTASDGIYNLARSAKQTASDNYQATLEPLSDFLSGSRGVLTSFFGPRWNTQWAQAGFISPTTAVPKQIAGQLPLALRLSTFFTANPTYQNAASGVTAANGLARRTATMTARGTLAQALIDLRAKQKVNNDAFDALVEVETTLLRILEGLLKANDPRWLAFGLNMPATRSTPGKPVNLRAAVGDDGEIVVQCDAVPLAARYRTRMLIVGVQDKYQLAFSGTDPMSIIKGVKPGVTLKIVMQAVNGGQQGVASDPILVTVPLPVDPSAEAPAAPAAQPTALLAPNGNGAANGNGKGHANGSSRTGSRVG